MQAVTFHGPGQKRWERVADPKIEQGEDAIVRRLGRGLAQAGTAGLPGEIVQVGSLHLVQPQHPRQRVQHLLGGGLGQPLFQARVVAGADPGELSELLAPESGYAARGAVRAQPDLGGRDPVPTVLQKRSQPLHVLDGRS